MRKQSIITLLLLITGCAQPQISYEVINNTVIINTTRNTEVKITQLSQAFYYNVGDYWDTNNDTGTNLYNVYLDWEWRAIESNDDDYDWSLLNDYGLREARNAEHSMIRLGVISTSAWIHNTWGTKKDAGYPEWLNTSNLTLVQDEYIEFITELIKQINHTPDFYLIEVEINSLGTSAGLTNQESINWLERLTNKIKELDPEAKVAIDVAALDLSPFNEEGRAINPELVSQDKYPLSDNEFLNRINHIDYDIISYHMQPFGWLSKGNWTNAREAIQGLMKYNRSIYLPWVAFLAKEPVVPEIEGNDYYIVNYSWEWQRDNTLLLTNYLLNNSLVIGAYYDYLDYTEPDVGGEPNTSVRLATGFTTGYRDENNEVHEGKARLVYEPMLDLWREQFTNITLMTNEAGITNFTGRPGKYLIKIGSYQEEIMIK